MTQRDLCSGIRRQRDNTQAYVHTQTYRERQRHRLREIHTERNTTHLGAYSHPLKQGEL